MKSRILLVEDEAGVALVVSDLLRAEGHAVETASDGKSGLRQATESKFDLLILDVMMPGLNGFELCHAVRERGFDGAILMLTAKGQIPDRVQGLRTGADDYLVKPFDPDELLARVAALLRRVHKEKLTPVLHFQFGDVTADFDEDGVYQSRRRCQPCRQGSGATAVAHQPSGPGVDSRADSPSSLERTTVHHRAHGRCPYRVVAAEIGAATPIPQTYPDSAR